MMTDIQGKHADLSITRPEMLCKIAKALSSELRVQIISELGKRSLSVGQLSKILDIPMSSVALAVKILEEAELIRCETQPGTHGSLKLCSRKLDSISIELVDPQAALTDQSITIRMPIGGYSAAEEIEPTCGLLSELQALGPMDLPSLFYVPDRFAAQLIWFSKGYLEYRFAPIFTLNIDEIDWIELSFEACSEAPMYRSPWPSDIYVDINGVRLGTWTCPSDCGGRKGNLTPDWWDLTGTQFGFLKSWRVDRRGTYLDSNLLSDVSLSDLHLDRSYITVRIGVDGTSENANGINLFGEKFGDHPQGLVLKIGYPFVPASQT